MSGILAAIIMVVAFSAMAPVWKTLRNNGVPTKAVLAVSGVTVPIWMILGLIMLKPYSFNWTFLYIVVLVAWVVGVIIRNSITTYLFRYKALTEMAAYGVAFSLVFSLIADIFFFGTSFEITSFIAFALFIGAGLLISKNKINIKKDKVGIGKTLLLLLFTSFLVAVFFSLYKVGLNLQEHILLHVAISQALLHWSLFTIGYSSLKENFEKKRIKVKHFVLVTIFLTVGVFGEAYALNDLPVSVVVVTAIIPMIMFALFDLKTKEFKITPKTLVALVMLLVGIVLLAV